MKVIGIFISIALMLAGGTALNSYISNPEQLTLTFDEYVRSKPDVEWLKLTECKLDVSESVYFTSKLSLIENPKEIFVPIKTQSNIDSNITIALVSYKEGELFNAFTKINSLKNEKILQEFYEENESLFFQQSTEISGMIRNWMDMDENEIKEIRTLIPDLAGKFVIINNGENPSMSSIFALPLGIILFIVIIFGRKIWKAPLNNEEKINS